MEVLGRFEKSLSNWQIILNLPVATISFLPFGSSPSSQNPLELPRD